MAWPDRRGYLKRDLNGPGAAGGFTLLRHWRIVAKGVNVGKSMETLLTSKIFV